MSSDNWISITLGELLETVSERYNTSYNEVVLVNTSDVLKGKVLNHTKVLNENLKGQFKKSFRYGDILYSEIRPVNRRYAFIDFDSTDYIASTKLMVLRNRCNKVHAKFIYRILTSDKVINELQTLAESRSGTFPQITFLELSRMIVKLPPLDEQKAISYLLDSIDEKIDTNNKIYKILEDMAQAIFKSWFVDFDPFTEGEFSETELGIIPKDWTVGRLGDLLANIRVPVKAGIHLQNKPYVPIDQIPIRSLGLNDFNNGEDAQSSLYLFEKDDILVGAMRVYFHRVSIAPFDGVTRSTCFILRSRNQKYQYLSLLLCNQNSTIEYAQNTSKGSTMPYAIWENGLANLPIIIPKSEDLDEFNNVISPIIKKLRDSIYEIRTLESLRDTLLPKLVSGEFRVPIEEDA